MKWKQFRFFLAKTKNRLKMKTLRKVTKISHNRWYSLKKKFPKFSKFDFSLKCKNKLSKTYIKLQSHSKESWIPNSIYKSLHGITFCSNQISLNKPTKLLWKLKIQGRAVIFTLPSAIYIQCDTGLRYNWIWLQLQSLHQTRKLCAKAK